MSVERDTISKEVIGLIAEQLNKSASTITEKDSLEGLGADSLDRVELVIKIEEHFGVEVSDEEADNMTTISHIVDYIQRKKSA